jgi:hypothetical protein
MQAFVLEHWRPDVRLIQLIQSRTPQGHIQSLGKARSGLQHRSGLGDVENRA